MLFRFELELSDIDRGIYTSLDFRLSRHPSETTIYLLTRLLAYTLSYQEGLEFSAGGLSDPEAPALLANGIRGHIDLWIEIGNPSAKKLHKASKAADQVRVYTYKNVSALLAEIRNNGVHRASEIKIFAIDSKFLQTLEPLLEKNNRWTILIQDGQLNIEIGSQSYTTIVETFVP